DQAVELEGARNGDAAEQKGERPSAKDDQYHPDRNRDEGDHDPRGRLRERHETRPPGDGCGARRPGRRGRRTPSDFHYLGFLVPKKVVDRLDVLVGALLNLVLLPASFVFRDLAVLLESLDLVVRALSRMTDGDACLLR